jgi:hypothetical protein
MPTEAALGTVDDSTPAQVVVHPAFVSDTVREVDHHD